MDVSEAISVMQQALSIAVKMSAPILLISMIIGIVISIFQAATQIHEQTITFVPKLITIAIILLFTGPWMLNTMVEFVRYIFSLM